MTGDQDGPTVRGVVRFPPGSHVVARRLVISVLDVPEADAPARTVASVSLPDVPTSAPAIFELKLPAQALTVPGPLLVRAHADVAGNWVVSVGDLVSTTATVLDPARPVPVVLTLAVATG